MNCPNCKAAITCGCQKRVASNGAQVCSTCLPLYEQMLAAQKKP
jgi:hypothetical protein